MELQRIVLAYSGSVSSSAAVRWLTEAYGADVVAVIVDVGQTDDLEELYTRALTCGALRAHVIDRREVFARQTILPAVAAPLALDEAALRHMADPVIASALVEVAAIEGAQAAAHAALDDGIDTEIARLNPALRRIAAARELRASGVDVSAYVRRHHIPPSVVRPERHLLVRPLANGASSAAGTVADVTIDFAAGVPASVNGVAMELEELIESLSLIGGQYGLTASAQLPAPAAVLLQAAYRECDGSGTVTLRLEPNSLTVIGDRLRPATVRQS